MGRKALCQRVHATPARFFLREKQSASFLAPARRPVWLLRLRWLSSYDYAYVEVTAVGPDTWNPEVHSPSFDVDIGEVYTMAFWAKTEPGKTRSTLFKFEQLDTWVGPWEIFALTDEWTE